MAEADRLQERSGAVHDVRARAARRWRRRPTSSRRRSRRPTSSCRAPAASRRSTCRSCWPASWRRRSPFIVALDARHLTASAAPAQLETALQLLYQSFTRAGRRSRGVRADEAAARSVGRQPRPQSRRRCSARSSTQINTSNHYTSQPLTPERVASLDRAKMIAFYRAAVRERRRLHVLHGRRVQGRRRRCRCSRVRRLAAVDRQAHRRTFKDLGDPLSRRRSQRARSRRDASREPDGHQLLRRSAAGPGRAGAHHRRDDGAARSRCATSLREELGQTYTVSVGLSQSLPQRGGGHIQVNFGAAPENIEAMTDRVMQEVKRLQEEGPSRGSDVAREGIGAARLRNVAAGERLLAAAAASGADARPRSRRDPDARSSASTR